MVLKLMSTFGYRFSVLSMTICPVGHGTKLGFEPSKVNEPSDWLGALASETSTHKEK